MGKRLLLVLFQTQSCGISLLKLWSWTCVHPLSTHLPLILSILKVCHWFIESLQVAQWLISCRRWLPLETMLTMQEVLYYIIWIAEIIVIIIIIKLILLFLSMSLFLDWKRSFGWLQSWERLLLETDVSTTCEEAIFRFNSEDGFHTGCQNISR